MTKWSLPEGRKPLTDADMAALTRRLADTAIEQSELYQAAKRDAEEAEAKLAQAVDALDWIGNHMVMSMALDQGDLCMMMKQHARATLAELKGEKP
jgi:hypothetical protein